MAKTKITGSQIKLDNSAFVIDPTTGEISVAGGVGGDLKTPFAVTDSTETVDYLSIDDNGIIQI